MSARLLRSVAGGAVLLAAGLSGAAQDAPRPSSAAKDEHAACHEVVESARYAVSESRYEVPDVTLVDAAGRPVTLRSLMEAREPVALNFIFTTCTTICPVMTATFAQMRRELGESAARVRLVSISIDPEQDRPDVLRRYAARYGAGEGWTFLTGDGKDVERVLRAFSAYTGSKMNHRPLTLLRAAPGSSWVRIDGLASGGELAQEVRARLLH